MQSDYKNKILITSVIKFYFEIHFSGMQNSHKWFEIFAAL